MTSLPDDPPDVDPVASMKVVKGIFVTRNRSSLPVNGETANFSS